MPQVYTIATKNAFAVLDESTSDREDDERILTQQPVAPQPTQPTRPVKPSSPKKGPASATRPGARRGGNEAGSGDEQPAHRPRANAPRPPKPERSDRQSGTGRGRENKKEGGGAYNWGNQQADFGGVDESTTAAPKEGDNSGAENETKLAGTSAPGAAVEEKPQTMSYADYKANQVQEQAFAPKETAKSEPKIEQGYQVYVKESGETHVTNSKPSAALGDEEKSRPKAMHLAELAAQNGGQLRFRAHDQPERNFRGNREQKSGNQHQRSRSDKQQQKKQEDNAASSSAQLNLGDYDAFPTL